MRKNNRITVIIPALNEEKALPLTLEKIPGWVDRTIVVDNGSSDRTAQIARQNGARVIHEPERGYGTACRTGVEFIEKTEIVVFLDGDNSDDPRQMDRLVDPIARGEVDFVAGARVPEKREPGSISLPTCFGNRLACSLIYFFWNERWRDLGPFRAIRYSVLRDLNVRDPDYGWNVEMQVKVIRNNVARKEVPVTYENRIGTSKISGTIRGVIGAGTKILWTLFWLGFLKKHMPKIGETSPQKRAES